MPARFVENRHRTNDARRTEVPAAIRAFHRSLPGYAPTPLVPRPDLARQLGLAQVLVKFESSRYGLGAFKALGASWALHQLNQHRPLAASGVATASEGNHGRAVAWAARLLGIPCVIFLPRHAAPERIANIESEGARVELVDGNYEDAVRRCADESRRTGWQVVSDVGYAGYLDIPLLIVAGYSTLFVEIDEQLAALSVPGADVALIPGGVGGLVHAGVEYYRGRPTRVVAVEPTEADCLMASITSDNGVPTSSRGNRETSMACLNCAEVSLSSWPAIRSGVDGVLAIDDGIAEEAMRRLYHAEDPSSSIAAGASGAAATGGLIALMDDPTLARARERLGLGLETVAVTICTEGAIDRAELARVLSAGPSDPA